MSRFLHRLGVRRKRFLMLVATCLCAAGGVTVAWADGGSGGDDPGLFTFDTLLDETVPIANDAALRSIYISPTAEESSGTVALDEGLTPTTDEPSTDVTAETAEPQPYPPRIDPVSASADPTARPPIYSPDVVDATTAYDVFDGTTGTTVWAGGIAGDATRGVFLKTVESAAGSGEPATFALAGTGAITLTRFQGDDLFFVTQAGEFGIYHIAAGTADIVTLQAFASPISNAPTINRAVAGRTIPIKWRLTDAAGDGISDPATFLSVTSGSTTCSSTDPTSDIETYSGDSGLQYLGDGWWQFNWATPAAYAGECRTMRLNLADSSTGPTAIFEFR